MHFSWKNLLFLKFQRIDLECIYVKNTHIECTHIYVSMLSMYQLSFNGSTFRIYTG